MYKISSSKFFISTSIGVFLTIIPLQVIHAEIVTYPASITTKNPCNKTLTTIHGVTMLSIENTPKGVFVYEHFSGSEGGYSANFYGRGKFSKTATSYKIVISGEYNGPTIFRSTAIDLIYSGGNGTQPTGDAIQSMSNFCILR